MLKMIAFIAGAAFLLFILAGFFASFWRAAPKPDNSSPTDWGGVAGNPSSDHNHHGSDLT